MRVSTSLRAANRLGGALPLPNPPRSCFGKMKGGLAALLCVVSSVAVADEYDFARERCVHPQVQGDAINVDNLAERTPEEAGIKLAFELGNPPPEVYADQAGQLKLAVNFRLAMRGCRVWGFDETFDEVADVLLADFLSLGLVTAEGCRGYDPQIGHFAFAVSEAPSGRNRFVTAAVLQAPTDSTPEVFVFETPRPNLATNCLEGLS